MLYQGSSRIGSLEHEADIRRLSKKLKQLKGELNKVKQLRGNETPIESLNVVELLVTEKGKLDEHRIQAIKKTLVDEATKDDPVAVYKAKVEASLYERMCAFFAFEIKTNQPVRDILEAQLLAEINLTSEDLEKSLRDVAKAVPQVLAKLHNLRLTIQQVGYNLDRLKGRLEEVMEVVTTFKGNVQQIEALLKEFIQGKQYTPRPIFKIVLPGNGDLDELTPQQRERIIALIREASGDVTIEFLGEKKGSIVLFFEGSQEGFDRLEEFFRSGELAKILDVPVEAVQLESAIASQRQTSRLRREYNYPLSLLQCFALIRPLKGFSHRAIEVIDKFKDASFELSNASEIGSSE